MKAVIVGCGRVGGLIATSLDASGHDVIIIDLLTRSFDRLPPTFGGEAVRGDGTDEDALRRAGAAGAEFFLALTEGDNRNIMSAQLAREALGIETVYAKVNDPMRAQAYAELGIGTVCRSTMIADALLGAVGLPQGTEPSIRPGAEHDHAPIGVGATAGHTED
ncbi:MAG TPA: NAD-binding protein [Coriobacteriia bacterium]